MGKCFVMQPFDSGAFDKRYDDIFEPAIKNADLEPYRVDRDPSVSIPIDDIETGIRRSELCLAEITTDNPNVWSLDLRLRFQKRLSWFAPRKEKQDSHLMYNTEIS